MTPGDSRSASDNVFDETEFHLPEDHWPLPELSLTSAPPPEPTTAQFVEVARTPEYERLRGTFRNFAFPMTIAGLTSYFVYVVLSIYATSLMAIPVLGSFNLGMLLGLAQFAVTWIWTAAYINFANKKLDPTSAALKAKLEKGAAA